MKSEELLQRCEEGVAFARQLGVDAAEVASAFGAGASIAFEKNDLNIAISDEETTFGVRVFLGGSVGFATSNDFDTLELTVRDALAIAKASVPDENNGLPTAREIRDVQGLHDPDVESVDVGEVTRIGADLLERARTLDARISIDSGEVGGSVTRRAIASSEGVRATEASTYLGCHLFGMAVDEDEVGSFIVHAEAQRSRAGFEEGVARCADRFVEKAVGALHPTKGESYRGLVLFTPEAAASLLVGNLTNMMSAAAIRKGKSPLTEKLGKAIASPLLHLSDDATVDGALGSRSFDREGIPPTVMTLVDDGVFAAITYNAYEARAAGWASGSTGHATGGSSNLPSAGPHRLCIRPGTTPLDTMIADAGRTILVTRFSGSTDAVTGQFSGVVKAGFLLDGGERRPVAETLIAGNLLEVFRDIKAVSRETEVLRGQMEMPFVLADGISVTAG